jgi:hypothetical protein
VITMGEFSKTLEDFQKSAGRAYRKLMDSLEEDYCWKCPMHSTSKHANCKELHAWIKIQKALEEGVWEKIREERSDTELEVITARFLEKRFKKEKRRVSDALVLIKVDDDLHPDVPISSALLIKPRPKKVKKGDLVLVPKELPCPVSWFYKAGLSVGVPFQITRVSKVYHHGSVWYLKTVQNLDIPIPLVLGVILKVLDKESSIYNFI